MSNFQIPKKHKAMTRSVAEALGVARMAGVYNYVEDPHDTAIVYVKCKPDTWSTIMHRAAQHTGVKHTGNAGKVARGEHA